LIDKLLASSVSASSLFSSVLQKAVTLAFEVFKGGCVG
jgi:hypothetical protein